MPNAKILIDFLYMNLLFQALALNIYLFIYVLYVRKTCIQYIILQKNHWLKCAVREMGGLVDSAPACYGSSLGSSPNISQK
jgi:hypothetical protein